jgi:hypothetical protein
MNKIYLENNEQKSTRKSTSYYTKENGLDDIELYPPEDLLDMIDISKWEELIYIGTEKGKQ